MPLRVSSFPFEHLERGLLELRNPDRYAVIPNSIMPAAGFAFNDVDYQVDIRRMGKSRQQKKNR